MKKLPTLLIALLFSIFSTQAQDLSLEEILNNHYEVMGYSKLKDVKNTIMTGKSVNQGMETPFTIYNVTPNQYRLEVPIQGQMMIQVYNAGSAWMVAPWSGSSEPQDLPKEQLKAMERQADIEGPLYNYADKGNTAELLGKEDMEGSEIYKVKLTYEDGDYVTYYIDAEDFVILKEENTTNMRGQEVKSEIYYSDFKPINDMIMPFSFEVKMNGVVAQSVQVEDVKYNQEIDPTIFDKPVSKAAEAEEK